MASSKKTPAPKKPSAKEPAAKAAKPTKVTKPAKAPAKVEALSKAAGVSKPTRARKRKAPTHDADGFLLPLRPENFTKKKKEKLLANFQTEHNVLAADELETKYTPAEKYAVMFRSGSEANSTWGKVSVGPMAAATRARSGRGVGLTRGIMDHGPTLATSGGFAPGLTLGSRVNGRVGGFVDVDSDASDDSGDDDGMVARKAARRGQIRLETERSEREKVFKGRSFLLEAPSEVRQLIYSYLLVKTTPYQIHLDWVSVHKASRGIDTRVMRVNKSINTEATKFLYANNAFQAVLMCGPPTWRDAERIRERYVKLYRTVLVDVHREDGLINGDAETRMSTGLLNLVSRGVSLKSLTILLSPNVGMSMDVATPLVVTTAGWFARGTEVFNAIRRLKCDELFVVVAMPVTCPAADGVGHVVAEKKVVLRIEARHLPASIDWQMVKGRPEGKERWKARAIRAESEVEKVQSVMRYIVYAASAEPESQEWKRVERCSGKVRLLDDGEDICGLVERFAREERSIDRHYGEAAWRARLTDSVGQLLDA